MVTAQLLCRECRNPLPEGARKCTNCSSYQDWRRFVFTWSGLFTAMLALVPLWSGAYSLWKLAFPRPADVRISIAACKPDRVLTYLNNSGETAAMLGQPRLEFEENGKWSKFDAEFEMDEDDLVSEPGEVDIVTLPAPEGGTFPVDAAGGCKLRVIYPVTSGAKEPGNVGATCQCEI